MHRFRFRISALSHPLREYATQPSFVEKDLGLRQALQAQLKSSMKEKNTLVANTIRSVLADVYSMDKSTAGSQAQSGAILKIIQKAVLRRADAAQRFRDASRSDLAEKEESEINALRRFLPATLPDDQIYEVIQQIVQGMPAETLASPKALSQILREFYIKIDKTRVDPNSMKQLALDILKKTTKA
jgi:uncharacterized protein YqeY